MTRVLHLTSSFPRGEGDHVAPFLLDLAVAQAAAGDDVLVLAPHDAGRARREVLRGVQVHRFAYAPARAERLAYRGGLLGQARTPAGALLLPALLGAFALAALRLARRTRPDVLHAHWWLPGGLVAVAVGAALRIPVVLTLHGSDVHLLHDRRVRAVGVRVLLRCAVVAAVSDDLRAQAAAALPAGAPAPVVLRLPLDVPRGARAAPAWPPRRLLAAGRLSPEKGFDVLLRAVAALAGEGHAVALDLVGSGTERDALEQLAGDAAAAGARVRLHPGEPRAALLQRMAAADAVVVPSRREGLGMVALEALAVGTPVVASRVGGLPEVVRDDGDGVLVAPDDVPALVAALRTARAAGAPPARALARHDPAEVVARHREAYDRAVRR